MEVGLFWWWSLDDVHLWRSLTHSFVSNSSGDDFIPIDKASWWCVIIFYSDLHSFVANGPCYYCIELWLILGVSLMKLLWKFFFFFFWGKFYENSWCWYLVWIDLSKRKNLQVPLRCISHALDHFGLGCDSCHYSSLA